jgi:hypothetical protein
MQFHLGVEEREMYLIGDALLCFHRRIVLFVLDLLTGWWYRASLINYYKPVSE